MLVRSRSQADLLDLRDVLIFLGIARAFVLFESASAQVRDATNGRVGASGNLDEVEAGLLGAAKRVFHRDNADLLAFFINDADLRRADLAIRARAGRNRRATSRATHVLPDPPAPVSVSRRVCASRR